VPGGGGVLLITWWYGDGAGRSQPCPFIINLVAPGQPYPLITNHDHYQSTMLTVCY